VPNDDVNPFEEELGEADLEPLPEAPDPYSEALWRAFSDLQEVKEQEFELTLRKARLKATIDALYPIVYPNPATSDLNSMSLSNAIRLIIQRCDGPVTPKEIRNRLRDFGYDLSKFANPLASIWTAANRMVEAEELVFADDEDEKKLTAGDKLKQVPEGTSDAEAALEQIYEQRKGA